MAKATLDIPVEVLDEAAQQTISRLKKEVASLERKLKNRDDKLAKIEAEGKQEQRAVDAINELIDKVKYYSAFAAHFERDRYW